MGAMIAFEQNPETFRVEERLRYALSGAGDWLFTRVEKRGLSTMAAKRRLSEMTGAPLRAIRHAGKKDAAATATQWLAWPAELERRPPHDSAALTILERVRHDRPLAVGHVGANIFRLRFQVADPAAFPPRERLAARFANYYGRQRFGRSLLTAPEIARQLRDEKPDKNGVSAAQAWLFNAFLGDRLARCGETPQMDDLWAIGDGRRWFAAPYDEVLAARWRAGEIAPTGPIFGYKAAITETERAWLAERGMAPESFRQWGKAARGARRPLFVVPDVAEPQFGEGCAEATLVLPAGAYATVWLTAAFLPERLSEPAEAWPDFTERTILVA